MKKASFKIFINGNNSKSRKLAETVKLFLTEEFGNKFDFEEVDVIKNPEKAEEYKIIAVPTILNFSQNPPVRIVGDITNSNKLKELLDFYSPNFSD
jgi:circadian clock protein KaiB